MPHQLAVSALYWEFDYAKSSSERARHDDAPNAQTRGFSLPLYIQPHQGIHEVRHLDPTRETHFSSGN
jgi:hypothetical protein